MKHALSIAATLGLLGSVTLFLGTGLLVLACGLAELVRDSGRSTAPPEFQAHRTADASAMDDAFFAFYASQGGMDLIQ